METGMIATVAIIMIIVVLPFALIIKNTKNKSKKLLKSLKAIALKHNSMLSEEITHGDFALGLDTSKKIIFFYKNKSEIEISKAIDLTNIISCSVLQKVRHIKHENKSQEIVEAIALSFKMQHSEIVDYFEFYNEKEKVQVNGEVKIAEEWKEKIDLLLNNKHKVINEKSEPKRSLNLSQVAMY